MDDFRGVGFAHIKEGKKITPLLTGGSRKRNALDNWENGRYRAASSKAPWLFSHGKPRLCFCQQDPADERSHLQRIKAIHHLIDVTIFSGRSLCASYLDFDQGGSGEVVVHAFWRVWYLHLTTKAAVQKLVNQLEPLTLWEWTRVAVQTAVQAWVSILKMTWAVIISLTKFKLIYEQNTKSTLILEGKITMTLTYSEIMIAMESLLKERTVCVLSVNLQ